MGVRGMFCGPHSLRGPSGARTEGTGKYSEICRGPRTGVTGRSRPPPQKDRSCQGGTRGPGRAAETRRLPSATRSRPILAGWHPGSSWEQPTSLLFPPPAPLTKPQPRAKRGTYSPIPAAEPLPPLPPPWVAHPSGLPPVSQVPKVLLGRPARRIEAHLRAYGRRGPASPRWSQGRCIWHLPRSREGSWPRSRSEQHPCLSAFGLSGLGRWGRGGNEQGTPAPEVRPEAEAGRVGELADSTGWAPGREGLLGPPGQGGRAQGCGTRRDTPLAPSIPPGPLCPPAGDKKQVRPVCPEKVCFGSLCPGATEPPGSSQARVPSAHSGRPWVA